MRVEWVALLNSLRTVSVDVQQHFTEKKKTVTRVAVRAQTERLRESRDGRPGLPPSLTAARCTVSKDVE